jgi:hypothetical protein
VNQSGYTAGSGTLVWSGGDGGSINLDPGLYCFLIKNVINEFVYKFAHFTLNTTIYYLEVERGSVLRSGYFSTVQTYVSADICAIAYHENEDGLNISGGVVYKLN